MVTKMLSKYLDEDQVSCCACEKAKIRHTSKKILIAEMVAVVEDGRH